jgi:hypothetical protein
MGSRQQTEGKGARLPALSRRAMLVGTSAAAAASGASATAPLSAQPPAFSDPTTLYKHWVSLDREIERLLLQWGDVEGRLMQEHNWYQLSEAERARLPEGQNFRDLDARLNRLFAERDGLLDKLPTRGARTLEAVAARLAVVERLLYRDDHPEAHAMVVGSRRDLAAIMADRTNPGRP